MSSGLSQNPVISAIFTSLSMSFREQRRALPPCWTSLTANGLRKHSARARKNSGACSTGQTMRSYCIPLRQRKRPAGLSMRTRVHALCSGIPGIERFRLGPSDIVPADQHPVLGVIIRQAAAEESVLFETRSRERMARPYLLNPVPISLPTGGRRSGSPMQTVRGELQESEEKYRSLVQSARVRDHPPERIRGDPDLEPGG